jgi:hypothetical protein
VAAQVLAVWAPQALAGTAQALAAVARVLAVRVAQAARAEQASGPQALAARAEQALAEVSAQPLAAVQASAEVARTSNPAQALIRPGHRGGSPAKAPDRRRRAKKAPPGQTGPRIVRRLPSVRM